jgi:hypothetical protein
MKKLILILGATALLLVTARATSTVFNTFGPGDTYDQASGFEVDNYNNSGVVTVVALQAAQFIAGASGDLASVDLGLTYSPLFVATAMPVNVYLAGSAGSPFDASNEIFLGSATPKDIFGSTNNSVVDFSVSGTVPVTIGTTYWLVLKPVGPNENVWNAASPLVPGVQEEHDFVFSSGSSFQSTTFYPYLPAFRLTASSGSSVPDSGNTLFLLFGATAALLIFRPRLVRG